MDHVLNEYFDKGVSSVAYSQRVLIPLSGPANFSRLVANIAPSLESLRNQQGSVANGVFVYRLMFAVRLAEFHQRRLNGELHDAAYDIVTMLREDIAPRSWWAVVLSDAVDLLQYGEYMFRCSGCRTQLTVWSRGRYAIHHR